MIGIGCQVRAVACWAVEIKVPPQQILIVSVGIGGAVRVGDLLHRQQVNFERSDHGTGDLVLNLEDVIKLTVVGLRPEVITAVHADKLGSDSHLIT